MMQISYFITAFSFLLFMVASYFSFSWLSCFENTDEVEEKKYNKIKLSRILSSAKKQYKSITPPNKFAIVFISFLCSACIFSIEYQKFNNISCAKIIFISTILICAAIIDYKTKLIPNILPLILFVGRFLFLPFEYFCMNEYFSKGLITSAVGLVVSFVFFFAMSKITKGGFGMGDVKLISCVGFVAGISSVTISIVFALICCTILGIVLMMFKKKNKKDELPFGPFILIGFIISTSLGIF